ncbi:MAG: hypothetical protein ACTHU0_39100 [Kofleriaceae bacterium]
MKRPLSSSLLLGAASYLASRSPRLRKLLPALPIAIAIFEYLQHRRREQATE